MIRSALQWLGRRALAAVYWVVFGIGFTVFQVLCVVVWFLDFCFPPGEKDPPHKPPTWWGGMH